MTKIETVRASMIDAMKAKDKPRKDSLSMLLSALKNAEIDKRAPLTEAEARLAIYKEFAPEDMSAEQITEVIKSVLSELAIETPTPADKGRIMKVLMPKVKGKADGKLVNQVLADMSH